MSRCGFRRRSERPSGRTARGRPRVGCRQGPQWGFWPADSGTTDRRRARAAPRRRARGGCGRRRDTRPGWIAYRRQREVARILRSAERQKRVECRDDGKDRRNRHDLPGNAGNVVPGAAAVVEDRRNEDEIQIAKRWADIERGPDRIEEIVEGGAAQKRDDHWRKLAENSGAGKSSD